jgi:hypothetical protein
MSPVLRGVETQCFDTRRRAEHNDGLWSKHGVPNLGSPPHVKQETFDTARCLETPCYMLVFYVSTLYIYFNLYDFSDTVQRLAAAHKQQMCV